MWVVFRGARCFKEAISYATSEIINEEHALFRQALSKVWDNTWKVIKEWYGSHIDKPTLNFTGFSLGGALANLAWSESHGKTLRSGVVIECDNLITFGAPRVFTITKAISLDIACIHRHLRYGSELDFICFVPSIFFGFRHAGTYYHLDAFGKDDSTYIKTFESLLGFSLRGRLFSVLAFLSSLISAVGYFCIGNDIHSLDWYKRNIK
jgi:hypothetical protein